MRSALEQGGEPSYAHRVRESQGGSGGLTSILEGFSISRARAISCVVRRFRDVSGLPWFLKVSLPFQKRFKEFQVVLECFQSCLRVSVGFQGVSVTLQVGCSMEFMEFFEA